MNKQMMRLALQYAQEALTLGEVPVGAVVAKGSQVLGAAFNLRETHQSPLAHAEIEAIRAACQALGDWRLSGCDLYVTLEPCPMCAGAILNARLSRVFFGAYDYHYGACGTHDNLFAKNKAMGTVEIYGGMMEEECQKLLKDFFKTIR